MDVFYQRQLFVLVCETTALNKKIRHKCYIIIYYHVITTLHWQNFKASSRKIYRAS